jgi:hypothetical protein
MPPCLRFAMAVTGHHARLGTLLLAKLPGFVPLACSQRGFHGNKGDPSGSSLACRVRQAEEARKSNSIHSPYRILSFCLPLSGRSLASSPWIEIEYRAASRTRSRSPLADAIAAEPLIFTRAPARLSTNWSFSKPTRRLLAACASDWRISSPNGL